MAASTQVTEVRIEAGESINAIAAAMGGLRQSVSDVNAELARTRQEAEHNLQALRQLGSTSRAAASATSSRGAETDSSGTSAGDWAGLFQMAGKLPEAVEEGGKLREIFKDLKTSLKGLTIGEGVAKIGEGFKAAVTTASGFAAAMINVGRAIAVVEAAAGVLGLALAAFSALAAWIASLSDGAEKLAESMSHARDNLDSATEAIQSQKDALSDVNGAIDDLTQRSSELTLGSDALQSAIGKARDEFGHMGIAIDGNVDSVEKLIGAFQTLRSQKTTASIDVYREQAGVAEESRATLATGVQSQIGDMKKGLWPFGYDGSAVLASTKANEVDWSNAKSISDFVGRSTTVVADLREELLKKPSDRKDPSRSDKDLKRDIDQLTAIRNASLDAQKAAETRDTASRNADQARFDQQSGNAIRSAIENARLQYNQKLGELSDNGTKEIEAGQLAELVASRQAALKQEVDAILSKNPGAQAQYDSTLKTDVEQAFSGEAAKAKAAGAEQRTRLLQMEIDNYGRDIRALYEDLSSADSDAQIAAVYEKLKDTIKQRGEARLAQARTEADRLRVTQENEDALAELERRNRNARAALNGPAPAQPVASPPPIQPAVIPPSGIQQPDAVAGATPGTTTGSTPQNPGGAAAPSRSFKEIIGEFTKDFDKPMVDQLKDGLPSVLQTTQGAFQSFFGNVLTGAKSVGGAFKGLASAILKSMLDVLTSMIAKKFMSFIFNSIGGFNDGGTVPDKANSGGFIRAANGTAVPTRDSVPILARPGEYVLRNSAVEAVGRENLDVINALGNRTISRGAPVMAPGRPRDGGKVNVWVVSPEQVPPPGPQDIIAAVGENIARGGALKKMIKTVAMGA